MRERWLVLLLPLLAVLGCGDGGEVSPPLGADCTSCHAFPPSSGRHALHVGGEGIGCQQCHAATVAADNSIADENLHDNGEANVSLLQVGTWDAASMSCDPACHGPHRW